MENMNKHLQEIARAAGEIILGAELTHDEIIAKSGHQNFVTYYDELVEAFIKESLAALYPEIPFLGEEGERDEIALDQPYFVVDPIDGTTNFIFQIPFVAISIALVHKQESLEAVVFNPYLEEMFTATKGQGAYLNGEKLQVKDVGIADSVFTVGMSPYNLELLETNLKLISQMHTWAIDLRRLGAAALDLCYVACNRQAGFCELELQFWDYAGGALILSEAGGKVSQITGDPLAYKEEASSILAATPKAHAEFLNKVDI